MAALSANKSRPVLVPAGGLTMRKLPLAGYTNFGSGSTAHTVYQGGPVASDVSDTDGYFRAVSSGVTWASGDVFGGISVEKQSVTSSDTADGSVEVSVFVNGIWAFPIGSIAITDIGAPIYVSDDDTATTSSTNTLWIGLLVAVDATYAWIDIAAAAGRANSAT